MAGKEEVVVCREGCLRRKRKIFIYVPRKGIHGERKNKDTERSEDNVQTDSRGKKRVCDIKH